MQDCSADGHRIGSFLSQISTTDRHCHHHLSRPNVLTPQLLLSRNWLPVEDETSSTTDTCVTSSAIPPSAPPTTQAHIQFLTLSQALSYQHLTLHALYSHAKLLKSSSQPPFRIKFLDGQLKRHQYSVTWQWMSGMEVTTCSTYEGVSGIMISRDKPNKWEKKPCPHATPPTINPKWSQMRLNPRLL